MTFFSIGSTITFYCLKHEKFTFSGFYCYITIAIELVCVILILVVAELKECQNLIMVIFSWIAIWLLGLTHGVIIAYFTTIMPRLEVIPHSK